MKKVFFNNYDKKTKQGSTLTDRLVKIRLNFQSLKLLLRTFFVFIILITMIGWSSDLKAQKSHFFIANGQSINVDTFNKKINYIMNEAGIPGMSLAIINDNNITYSNIYGYKQQSTKKKNNKRTIFEGASLTKSFLVFVVYRLVDEGKLDLDKPMYQYLENKQLEYDPRYKLITPRMILNHTSGIENWAYFNDPNKLEILSNPGEQYVYSGEAYNYLAKVLEKILNQSYDEYIKQMVFKPLHIKRTFTHYTHKGKSPKNFATGHNSFGEEIPKWKNSEAVPSTGMHLNAESYAKLIISLYNKKYLSDSIIKHTIAPRRKIEADIPGVYAAPGVVVLCSANDTIIFHGGNNGGFKNFMCYSLVNKKGLVFLTNGDRGGIIEKKMNELTVGLNIDKYFASDPIAQYPSHATTLLKVYNESNAEGMFRKLDELIQEYNTKIGVETLNELAYCFYQDGKIAIAKRLFEENKKLFPEAAISYYFLGKIFFDQKDYEIALGYFKKAKEYNVGYFSVEYELGICEKELAAGKAIDIPVIKIFPNDTSTIQAENYCAMSGIGISEAKDTGGGKRIGWTDPGNWMDYKVNVENTGTYSVALRIASFKGNGQIQILSGTSVLTSVDIPSTKSWDKWTTINTKINLSAGSQTLRLFVTAGGFDLNWIKFYATYK